MQLMQHEGHLCLGFELAHGKMRNYSSIFRLCKINQITHKISVHERTNKVPSGGIRYISSDRAGINI